MTPMTGGGECTISAEILRTQEKHTPASPVGAAGDITHAIIPFHQF